MKLKNLVGSGDLIGRFMLPFLVCGLGLTVWRPELFKMGESRSLSVIALIVLIPGVTLWLWSTVLILTKASGGKLITNGPFALMRHPLYTSVALLVLPGLGFLFRNWLGLLLGALLYLASRLYSPREEKKLADTFGQAWKEYIERVKLPWL